MESNRFAPILLFVYKRLDTLKLTVNSLQRNDLASESELFIFSDAAKSVSDENQIKEVRSFIKGIDGFKNIFIYESGKNKGLANSIIDGVTRVINEYGKVIVLEDDLLTSVNFLQFMNQCLDHYKDNTQLYTIAGYSFTIKDYENNDVYFTKRSSSWGWATWKDRWNKIDWQVTDYDDFKNDRSKKRAFNRMGSDLSSMLKKQMTGKADSWAVRWVYHQFKQDLSTVYPTRSKVRNIGFGKGATHTFDYFNRYDTLLDESGKRQFRFIEPYIDKNILKKILAKYSIFTRARYKLINFLPSVFSNNSGKKK
jgi:hypothetical protein